MLTIDGSQGEGGGQILRTALSLSIITRTPFQLVNIRHARTNPGLRPQHLTALKAAATISNAEVDGAIHGSSRVTFIPTKIRTGRYRFMIATAGAATLVLQTIVYPLSFAESASSLILIGGTHVPWAPCYHYLELNWLPYIKQMGFSISLKLERTGYYPQGGGRISATIRPAPLVNPTLIPAGGKLVRIFGVSGVTNLPLSIAKRQKRQAIQRLQDIAAQVKIKSQSFPGVGKGTFLFLGMQKVHTSTPSNLLAGFSALGALGKPAERVADDAVDELRAQLITQANLDQYLADQLLIPAAFAHGSSSWHTPRVTNHLLTNAAIIQKFLPAKIEIDGQINQPGTISITPSPISIRDDVE